MTNLMCLALLSGMAVLSFAANRLENREPRNDQGWSDLGMSVWIALGLKLVLPVLLWSLWASLHGPLKWLF